MAKCLKIALRLEQLPNVCISKYVEHSIRLDNIKDLLSPFFQRVQVVTVEDLEVELAMKNSTSSVIGTAKVEFYLNTAADSSNFCLYLDSKITRMVEEHIHKTMVQELLGAINKIIATSTPGIVVPEVHEAFCLFLKSKTDEELHKACREEEQFTDAAEAKKHLCQQLKQIWKMDEPERSRAIRRLYLRWHPDKNLGNVNEVFVLESR